MNEMEYWYWINNIEGIGRIVIRRLLECFGNPKAVFDAEEQDIREIVSKNKNMLSFLESRDPERIRMDIEQMKQRHIGFLYPDSKEYPYQFREITDSPYGIYYYGKLPDKKKSIAIIGARNASRYGLEMARFFGRELAKCGISIISGLARGIDGNAHRGALEAGGYTLGILGCGIDQVYPLENYELFMQMKETGGILSESNIGVAPHAGLFPQRNRLIAAMCDGILIIEAMEKSGTFITVDQGLEYGKDIFAIPGRITDVKSVGCNNLIKYGAHVVTNVEDILEVIDRKNTSENHNNSPIDVLSNKNSLAPLEKIVYDCLRIEARYLDEIIDESKVAPQDVCKALNMMSLRGIVVEPTRNYFAIKI